MFQRNCQSFSWFIRVGLFVDMILLGLIVGRTCLVLFDKINSKNLFGVIRENRLSSLIFWSLINSCLCSSCYALCWFQGLWDYLSEPYLSELFSLKTVTVLIILLLDSRNIAHLSSISFSTNPAFKSGLGQFGQNQ